MAVHQLRKELALRMDVTAAASARTIYHRLGGTAKVRIVSAYLVPDQDVAADAANTTTLALKTGANVAGLATLDDHDTTTGQEGALTAGTPVQLEAAVGTEIDAGDLIAFTKTDAGTGKAFSGAVVLELIEV